VKQLDYELGLIFDRVSLKLDAKEYEIYWYLRYKRMPYDSPTNIARELGIPRTTYISRKKKLEEKLRKLIIEMIGEDGVRRINEKFFRIGDFE
jgi:DNA-binding Lrp family transcriptional regulator